MIVICKMENSVHLWPSSISSETVIAAITTAPLTFGFPPLFFLATVHRKRSNPGSLPLSTLTAIPNRLHCAERFALYFLVVLSAVLSARLLLSCLFSSRLFRWKYSSKPTQCSIASWRGTAMGGKRIPVFSAGPFNYLDEQGA